MADVPEAPAPVPVPAPVAPQPEEDLDADLPTEVVVREVPDDPDEDFPTEVVDRAQPDAGEDATCVTIALDRSVGSSADGVVGAGDEVPVPRPSLRGRRTARRRGITFPAMDPGARTAVPAVGPGAVESYPVRVLPPPPPAPAEVEGGPAATRAPAPAMPSVERSSRRIGRITVALVAGAIVVSALGLAGIASLIFG